MSAHNQAYEQLSADYEGKDPGNGNDINVDRCPCVISIETAAAETRTLPNPPRAGVSLNLVFLTDGGDCVITAASDVDQSGNNVITLNDAGDTVALLAVRTTAGFSWRLIANVGATLA